MGIFDQLTETPEPMASEDFFNVVVQHFPYIQEKGLYDLKMPEAVEAEVYQGDFYGLQMHLKVLKQYRRFNTAFNGFHSSMDYDGSQMQVKIIAPEFIQELYNAFLSRHR